LKMSPKERVLAALGLQEPDTVPLYEHWINASVVEKLIGRRSKGYLGEPECLLHCYKMLGIDMSFVIVPGFSKEWLGDREVKGWLIPMVEIEPNLLVDEWGRTWRYIAETDQSFLVAHPIKSIEDVENYHAPDPHTQGVSDNVEFVRKKLKKLDYEMAINCWVPGPVENTVWNTGLENLVSFLYQNPKAAEKIMDITVNYSIEMGREFIDRGADVIDISDDCAWKGGPYFHPELYRKFVVPRLKRMIETFKNRGAKVILHSDGNLYPILDDLISTGIDGLHSLEPQAGMDIGYIKERYGHRICLLGNIDVSYTLPFGNTEDVEREVKERVATAAPRGGYILSSSNSICKAVPPQNVIAMFKAGRKYGRYPIKVERGEV